MSDHKLAEALRRMVAAVEAHESSEFNSDHPALHASAKQAREALAAHEAEQQAGEAVGACLKVIKGELCYRSRDEDQSFGMWVPVAPDSDHGFNNGAEFAPFAAHPQQPLKREQQAVEAVAISSEIVSAIDAVEFRREQYNLNCNQWSAVLGVLPSHYSEFIHGKRPLPVSAIANAYAFGVPADALLQQLPTKGAADIDRRLAELEKLRAHGITKDTK